MQLMMHFQTGMDWHSRTTVKGSRHAPRIQDPPSFPLKRGNIIYNLIRFLAAISHQPSKMSTASPVQRTKPKLAGPKKRESCDACSSQKTRYGPSYAALCCFSHSIRCSKARPSCSRCISKGIDCVYGISRRTGRRKYRSPNASPQTTPQKDATPLAFVDDFFDPLTPLNSLNDRSRATDSFPTMDMDTPYFDFLLQPNLSCMPQSDSFSPSVGSSGTISDIDENLDLFGLPSLSPQPLQPPGQMIQAISTAPTSAPTAKDHQAAQHNTTTEGCITTALKLVSDLRMPPS